MDKIYQEEWGYFEKEKGTLPAWFRTYEHWKIKYNDAFCRLNTVVYRTYKLDKAEEVPPHYHDFLAALPLDNQEAQNVDPYYFFLYEVFNLSLNQKDSTHCPPDDFLTYHLCQAERTLSPEIRDAFKAFTLQNVYNYLKPEIARDFIRRDSATIFHDPAWLTQLHTYFDSKEKHLQAELPAPNFMLIDERDSLVSLRSLRGNIVVLCFWFAGCKPCIEEFPEENRLVARFKDQPVRLVSVCVNTSRSHWERYSKKYDLQTLNLWANDQWNSTVVEKYALAAFPRYVVIDPNQRVIAANAPRPSQGLEEYLQKVLDKSTPVE